MKGSLKIAKLFGVPVYLHWTFIFVPVAVFFLWKQEETGTKGLLWLSLFATCLFISILLHEYGHVLMAKRFGVSTKDIILLPIGGLARLTKLPQRPAHELLVALAGPMVNVLISLLLLPYLIFVFWKNIEINSLPLPEAITENFAFLIPLLFALNLLLALFNLIPAFPMDGGRILRALLSMKFSRLKSTWVATFLGQLIAVGMILFAMAKSRPSYTFIGIFIYITARREYRWVRTESLLQKHTVEEAYRMALCCIPKGELIDNFSEEDYLFFVNEEKRITGWINISMREKENIDFHSPEEMMRPLGPPIQISDDLKTAHEDIQAEKSTHLIVYGNGIPLGVLEEWMIWECLEKANKNI